MDTETWDKNPAILITAEDLEGDDIGKILSFARYYPQKKFLLPSSVNFAEAMESLFASLPLEDEAGEEENETMGSFSLFAQNLEFAHPVTVCFESNKIVVDDLATLLNEWLTQIEKGAYLIAPDERTSSAIKRELAILGLFIRIYEPSEAENANWETKLGTVKDELVQEIPRFQENCQNLTNKLKGKFVKESVEKFSKSLADLAAYYHAGERQIRLKLCGDENKRLTRFLEGYFYLDDGDGTSNYDLSLFVLPPQINKDFIEKLTQQPSRNMQFLVYRPIGSPSANIPRSKIISQWQRELSQIGFEEHILLFAEGAEIFDAPPTEEEVKLDVTIQYILDSKEVSGQAEYQMERFLEKIFAQNSSLTGKELLSRLGLWQLLEYCCEIRRINVSSGKIAENVSVAADFLTGAKWKILCASYETEMSQRLMNLNEVRLKLEIAAQKFDVAVGEPALKAVLYDTTLLIDEFISQVHTQGNDALRKLLQEDLLNEANMENIYAGRESNLGIVLGEIVKEAEEKAAIALEELKNNLAILLQKVSNRFTSASKSLGSATEDLEQDVAPLSLPEFEMLSLNVIEFPSIIDEEMLLKLVRNNTEVLCVNVGDKLNTGKGAIFEYHYLYGSFSVELLEALGNSLTTQITEYRKKLYEEVVSYIKHVFNELAALPQTEIERSKISVDALQASITREKEANAIDFKIWEEQRSQLEPFINIWKKIDI